MQPQIGVVGRTDREGKEGREDAGGSTQKRNAFVAPDAKVLRAVRKAIKDRDDAQVRIEASLITLEIVPKKAGSVEVITGEMTGMLTLKPDVPTQIKGSPEVVADIPEVARLRAWGPVGSVEEHREARAKAHRELKELMEPFRHLRY